MLSSHAKARAEVVPKAEAMAVQLPLFKEDKTVGGAETVLAPEPRRKPWAWLLRHVFEIDVTICPRCRGVTRWLEAATKPDAIARLLSSRATRSAAPDDVRWPTTSPPFSRRSPQVSCPAAWSRWAPAPRRSSSG